MQQDLSYAFIVEEPSIRAALRLPPCLLQAVPTNFYRRFYSLAVRKCSPLKERLNSATMEMMDNGSFDRMVLKWWGVDHCGVPTLGTTLLRCLTVSLFTFLLLWNWLLLSTLVKPCWALRTSSEDVELQYRLEKIWLKVWVEAEWMLEDVVGKSWRRDEQGWELIRG